MDTNKETTVTLKVELRMSHQFSPERIKQLLASVDYDLDRLIKAYPHRFIKATVISIR